MIVEVAVGARLVLLSLVGSNMSIDRAVVMSGAPGDDVALDRLPFGSQLFQLRSAARAAPGRGACRARAAQGSVLVGSGGWSLFAHRLDVRGRDGAR